MIRNAIVAAAISLAGLCWSGEVWAQDTLHIRIATEGAYAPWNYTLPDGTLAGYEIDLAKELCKRMKAQCEIVAQNWDGMLPALNAGKFDAIIASMGVTPERAQVAAFSDPYSTAPNAFLAMKGSGLAEALPWHDKFDLRDNAAGSKDAKDVIEKLDTALKGKVLGIQGSTTAGKFVDEYLKGVVTVRSYKTQDEANLDVLAGRIDLTMANITVLAEAMKRPDMAEAELVGPTFLLASGTCVAFRKSDTVLKDAFNAAIHAVNADGFNKALTEKWFGVDISAKN
ncbi:transporter substrate-binding domain-containing protein [Mesorhizobium sp. M4A.F.Ca.ET.050.02.1.1]|uniref:transporter substrate-binding domain-containing protein n=1 Tax=unclassified Mesorhizobium TaxID=325217 RepID=UPI000FCA6DE7|nr:MULTISPECIES: transporter substrate-binding domain-containing protein [unclassified Mesorhizobium]RUX49437.1 transporter substrate-binding domain-containing protein [Mesorhizobium sp. M4A.F.Ca.ET.050.02.1.1]RWD29285.1 MAG: transporter substrate-binding domain-containing protein [Mesorhizobium sp.]TIW24650.1 MAG: transporter substrate-binding domain-containing protein [Mesorhizobium sp.]